MAVSAIQHRVISQLLYFLLSKSDNKFSQEYNYYNKLKLMNDIHPNPGPSYNLQIGYTNIRSLFSDTDNSMLVEVQDCKFNDMIKDFIYIYNCDLIFLTETWLQDNEMNKYQLHIKGYRDPIYKNRNTVGGGLLIYYKENFIVNRLHNLEDPNLENLVIEVICSQNIKFIYNLIYRSPTSQVRINEYIVNNMYDSYNYSIEKNYTGIFFIGDFNYPNISWSHSEKNNHIFYDTLTQLGLCQMINEPTRINNILDLVITDSPGFVKNITINPPIKTCDHNSIYFEIIYQDKPIKILPRKIYKYQLARWDKINQESMKISWLNQFYSLNNIEQMVEYLENKIYEQMDKHIPHFILSNTKRKTPWLNYDIKKFITIQRRFKRIYKENPSPYNKNKYLNVKIKLDDMIKNAKLNYYSNISENLKKKNCSSRKF